MVEWRDIEGASNYEVSNIGIVRNKTTQKELKGRVTKTGYLQVSIKMDETGTFTNKYIHRLVALAFIENNNEEKKQVNHIDGNKSNNTVSNLEWCTNSENQKHAWEHGLSVNKGQKPVGAYDINDNLILSFNSIEEAAKYFNKKRVNIDNALHHKQNQKTAYGYVWKFLN